ncbi:MAG TPA: BON domain-containing protein [Gammaproteobacteria bacterium]|jgi:osmotically-inducible protein OsmY|nr:BON domain-containing protein [Gammaproteobacteria bacterium]
MEDQHAIKAIKAALTHDTSVNLRISPIAVRAEGGMIRLEGEVENIAVKRNALRIARQAVASAAVLDNLYVRTNRPRGDDELKLAVLETLKREPAFAELHFASGEAAPPAGIAASAAAGRVTLTGTVPSLSHRRLAEVLAWWTPGTRDVHNRLHVQPAEHDHDGEITDAIRLVLDKEPALDDEEVHVETEHGAVTLRGRVGSDTLRAIAAADCWYVPGVHSVDNRLEVRPG